MRRVVPLALMHCMFCFGDFDHEEEQESEKVVMTSFEHAKALFPMLKTKTILTVELERNIRHVVTGNIRQKMFEDCSREDLQTLDSLINVDVWQVLLDEIDRLREGQRRL